ncbi:unnamed protein product [Taenia asiatica]|uniref:Saposin B-type domain-containing protein n=1 Tax=Taenia asiatica TaxID=60517 RepID=A0A0R3VX39_TAEAS|nr:unnamed protein product [Taenia asiatica]
MPYEVVKECLACHIPSSRGECDLRMVEPSLFAAAALVVEVVVAVVAVVAEEKEVQVLFKVLDKCTSYLGEVHCTSLHCMGPAFPPGK